MTEVLRGAGCRALLANDGTCRRDRVGLEEAVEDMVGGDPVVKSEICRSCCGRRELEGGKMRFNIELCISSRCQSIAV